MWIYTLLIFHCQSTLSISYRFPVQLQYTTTNQNLAIEAPFRGLVYSQGFPFSGTVFWGKLSVLIHSTMKSKTLRIAAASAVAVIFLLLSMSTIITDKEQDAIGLAAGAVFVGYLTYRGLRGIMG